jgi:hypothetical protein
LLTPALAWISQHVFASEAPAATADAVRMHRDTVLTLTRACLLVVADGCLMARAADSANDSLYEFVGSAYQLINAQMAECKGKQLLAMANQVAGPTVRLLSAVVLSTRVVSTNGVDALAAQHVFAFLVQTLLANEKANHRDASVTLLEGCFKNISRRAVGSAPSSPVALAWCVQLLVAHYEQHVDPSRPAPSALLTACIESIASGAEGARGAVQLLERWDAKGEQQHAVDELLGWLRDSAAAPTLAAKVLEAEVSSSSPAAATSAFDKENSATLVAGNLVAV